jgi:phage major head subunit gpT-like protein
MKTMREARLENNKKMLEAILYRSPENKRFAESMKRDYGLDIWDEKKFPVAEPTFSFMEARNKLAEKMKEADVSSAFPQLLRAGVLNLAAKGYQMTETTFEQFTKVIPSKKYQELYAPSHGVAFPNEVSDGQLYPEVGAAALNESLINRKFGSIYSVTKELLDDDQTGQIQEGASELGQYLKILTEVLVYGKLASVSSMSYGGYNIPKSETQPSNESNWPWTTTSSPFIGGGFNRPASYGLPSIDTFNAANVQLMSQKNLQGLKMGIVPDTIITGPNLSFNVATLLNSSFYPVGASAAGVVGGNYSINPVKGLYVPIVSPFVFKQDGTVNGDSKAWYVTDVKKSSFIVQMREAVSVTQEAPNTGANFERDLFRFKGSMRGNADFIDPRFWWQGDDGSVTS